MGCKYRRELQGHIGLVTSESVAFSPYGDQIVSGSRNDLWVWDARTGERLRKLQGHTDEVNTVAFSPDGNRIVSGSRDNSVRVWDNLNLDTSWVVNENGWIISGGEKLAWVPSSISNVLLRPHNTLALSRKSVSIFFTQCKLGTIWLECYSILLECCCALVRFHEFRLFQALSIIRCSFMT